MFEKSSKVLADISELEKGGLGYIFVQDKRSAPLPVASSWSLWANKSPPLRVGRLAILCSMECDSSLFGVLNQCELIP